MMVLIYFLGTISGAHLNPSVIIAFALRRHFLWRRVYSAGRTWVSIGYVASMNLVQSLASDIVRCSFGHSWIYLADSLCGGLMAVADAERAAQPPCYRGRAGRRQIKG